MDQEFDKVENIVDMVEIKMTAAHEHVGEIERNIRVIKECSCAIVSNLPYKILPRQVIIHLIYFSVFWLNSLPSAVGISEKYSPRIIVTGRELDFNNTSKPPLNLTSKSMKTKSSPTQCKHARSLAFSLVPPATSKARTRFST
jgi:hypothetical protein